MKKAVVFLFVFFSIVLSGCKFFANVDTYENIDMTPREISVTKNSSTVELVEQVKSAVVGIQCNIKSGYSIGSGVAISDGGYILTNQHVVDGAKSIKVYFADKTSATATIIWQDIALDLAVIKSSVNMPYLICSSNPSNVGEDIIAIGTPLTLDFKHTVTKGIISALNRTLEVPNKNGTISYMQNLIQHDASINAGNSGGPIINSNGEVIGINTLKVSDAEGLGFAIPISVGKTVIEKLNINEEWTPSYMGVFGLDTEVAMFKGETLSTNKGVYVASIDENTISKDYFKKGDIIVEINGQDISTLLDLRLQLYKYKAGDNLNIIVMRDGERTEIRYHLLSR